MYFAIHGLVVSFPEFWMKSQILKCHSFLNIVLFMNSSGRIVGSTGSEIHSFYSKFEIRLQRRLRPFFRNINIAKKLIFE